MPSKPIKENITPNAQSLYALPDSHGTNYTWKFPKDDQPSGNYVFDALRMFKAILTGGEVEIEIFTNELTDFIGVTDFDEVVRILTERGADPKKLSKYRESFAEEGNSIIAIELDAYTFNYQPRDFIRTVTISNVTSRDLDWKPNSPTDMVIFEAEFEEREFRFILYSDVPYILIV